MEALSTRHLGNSDITKLLDDLDNQTEAIKSGQEIGEELLGGKKHMTRIKDSKLEITNNNFFGKGMIFICIFFISSYKHRVDSQGWGVEVKSQ